LVCASTVSALFGGVKLSCATADAQFHLNRARDYHRRELRGAVGVQASGGFGYNDDHLDHPADPDKLV
jgi:hypothetical protein